MSVAFKLAHTTGTDAGGLARRLLAQLGELPTGANIGFIYATDALARELEALLRLLKEGTGIDAWIGTVGIAISVTNHEYYDQPAVAVMAGRLPPDSFRLLPAASERPHELPADVSFGIVHGDPANPATPALVEMLGRHGMAFFTGGITSSQSENLQVAGDVTRGGVSGVAFTAEVPVITSHTQGCTPIGAKHRITQSQRNILAALDDRPALDVFREDIGEVLAKDLNRVGGYIFAAFPIAGSDTGDYLVRNLIGIDTGQKLIAIGDYLEEDAQIMFCRRDGNTARADMRRMLEDLRGRANGREIAGGVYVSCLGRGRQQFGDDSEELRLIGDVLGDFPLVGFFANGEIFNSRLYGYTGVLTLFLR